MLISIPVAKIVSAAKCLLNNSTLCTNTNNKVPQSKTMVWFVENSSIALENENFNRKFNCTLIGYTYKKLLIRFHSLGAINKRYVI